MMESQTIPKNIDTQDDQDFEFLRSEGLRHIRELSRKLWTDYNVHDPGITLLEALCYAITDLGNRINQPVRDLLADAESGSSLSELFPTPGKILTTGPVSPKDYRKLFIDIPKVNNVFIRRNTDYRLFRHCLEKDETSANDPAGKLSFKEQVEHYRQLSSFTLQGLYDIYFEPVYDIKAMPDNSSERRGHIGNIVGTIKQHYHENRNLCEDLGRIEEVDYFDVMVCGDIEIERDASASRVMADILFQVQQYLSPSVRRYTLAELLEQDKPVEDIFDGPVLQHGFITDEDLHKAEARRSVHLSDIVQIVMETPGVVDIKKLKVGPCGGSEVAAELRDVGSQKWSVELPDQPNIMPRLCRNRSFENTNLFKDVIPVPAGKDAVLDKLDQRIAAHHQELDLGYDDISIEKGRPVQKGSYRSVQNDLPQLYGTGPAGLSPSLPDERHAKAKQLKGYLMFFDQILATYFGHLKNIGSLLSGEMGTASYFAAEIEDVRNVEDIVRDQETYQDNVGYLLSGFDHYTERKNTFLDHLLARFSENMSEYAFAMFEDFGEDITAATLYHKSVLLDDYAEISYNRSKGFNWMGGADKVWNTHNVSGLEHRLARLLGTRDYRRRNLSDSYLEVYPEEDEDDIDEWRWRIRDEDGEILLASSGHYESRERARDDMRQAVNVGWNPDRYKIKQTSDGQRYYFNLTHRGEVAGRHMHYFDSRAEAELRIEHLAEYMFHSVSEEGLFCFEHILLRPDRDDVKADEKLIPVCMERNCSQCKPHDPYSLQLSVILPGWIPRFSNMYFREYAEQVIRREVPAHILCRICWIGNTAEDAGGEEGAVAGPMAKLEKRYSQWLVHKMEHPKEQDNNSHLKPLVNLLHDLESVYPQGVLHDCDTAGEGEPQPSIILGKSMIGELNQEDDGNE